MLGRNDVNVILQTNSKNLEHQNPCMAPEYLFNEMCEVIYFPMACKTFQWDFANNPVKFKSKKISTWLLKIYKFISSRLSMHYSNSKLYNFVQSFSFSIIES